MTTAYYSEFALPWEIGPHKKDVNGIKKTRQSSLAVPAIAVFLVRGNVPRKGTDFRCKRSCNQRWPSCQKVLWGKKGKAKNVDMRSDPLALQFAAQCGREDLSANDSQISSGMMGPDEMRAIGASHGQESILCC